MEVRSTLMSQSTGIASLRLMDLVPRRPNRLRESPLAAGAALRGGLQIGAVRASLYSWT
ncbi:MAG: hypothetical protein ACI84E_002311 [Planctomycetota bacterium]|jgi:hypothetical protein